MHSVWDIIWDEDIMFHDRLYQMPQVSPTILILRGHHHRPHAGCQPILSIDWPGMPTEDPVAGMMSTDSHAAARRQVFPESTDRLEIN